MKSYKELEKQKLSKFVKDMTPDSVDLAEFIFDTITNRLSFIHSSAYQEYVITKLTGKHSIRMPTARFVGEGPCTGGAGWVGSCIVFRLNQ